MLSRQALSRMLCTVVETDDTQALIRVDGTVGKKGEFFHWIVPLNFCPSSARQVGRMFELHWEFIANLNHHDARVYTRAI